jgi:hypothetical protein
VAKLFSSKPRTLADFILKMKYTLTVNDLGKHTSVFPTNSTSKNSTPRIKEIQAPIFRDKFFEK